ncbi:alpha/beta fold hydrolase [Sorangium sp. So ce385]|uniref:alpha/beta fold hydrolase n=1 Tax=Sorangium sp. So ce385 TaxID=3133308 RepID=UPI003F5B3412
MLAPVTAPLRLLLLPGLDGTGALFAPFVEALSAESADIAPEVVSYPADRALDYDALEALVAARLPADGPYALLGESFSGPLALRLACRRAGQLVGVALVATFVTNPVWLVPSLARHLVGPWLFRRRAPELVARRYLVGARADAAWLERVAANVETVDPAVMAARVREVLSVDARAPLQRCAAPLLYLGAAGDALVPPRVLRELRRLRPDLECVTVDAPHLVLQLAPEASARAIAGFLRRAAAKVGGLETASPRR